MRLKKDTSSQQTFPSSSLLILSIVRVSLQNDDREDTVSCQRLCYRWSHRSSRTRLRQKADVFARRTPGRASRRAPETIHPGSIIPLVHWAEIEARLGEFPRVHQADASIKVSRSTSVARDTKDAASTSCCHALDSSYALCSRDVGSAPKPRIASVTTGSRQALCNPLFQDLQHPKCKVLKLTHRQALQGLRDAFNTLDASVFVISRDVFAATQLAIVARVKKETHAKCRT